MNESQPEVTAEPEPKLASTPPADDPSQSIRALPREVGVMLVSVGVIGFVLPGMAGTPALLAGGMVLWPELFGKLEDRLRRNYPETHRQGMRQIGRYIADFKRRFPEQS
jgi:hypothetical protein